MNIYFKALAGSLFAGVLFVWGFYQWRLSSLPSETLTNLSFMEKLEKEGFPRFQLTTVGGATFNSDEHKGKVILVNFWASWCAPCLEEFPSMLKLVEAMKGRMILLAISQDSQKGEIEAFLKTFPQAQNPNVFVVWDEKKEVAKQFLVSRLPESYLSDGQYRLAKKIIGSIDWFNPDSVRYIESLLQVQPGSSPKYEK